MSTAARATEPASGRLHEAIGRVSGKRMAQTVATLAGEAFAGRRVGSTGGTAGHLNGAAAVEAGGPAHALLAALDQAGRHIGLPLAAGPVASDNRRYGAAGLAAIGIGAGMAGYHSPADTPDRVETATLVAVARLVVATALLVGVGPATVSS